MNDPLEGKIMTKEEIFEAAERNMKCPRCGSAVKILKSRYVPDDAKMMFFECAKLHQFMATLKRPPGHTHDFYIDSERDENGKDVEGKYCHCGYRERLAQPGEAYIPGKPFKPTPTGGAY